MTTVSALYKVVLLTGPLKGLELLLNPGETTFGLGDCDVITPLDTPEVTMSLTADKRGVWLNSVKSIWCDGRPYRQGDLPLPFNSVLDIDGLAIILGRKDECLSLVDVPRRRRFSSLVAILGTTFLLSVAILFLWGCLLGVEQSAQQLSSPEWLAQQHKKDEYKTLRMHWQDERHLEISGRCPAQKALTVLQQQLVRRGVRVITLLSCDDQLLSSVRYALDQFGYDGASVTIGAKPGEVLIRGQMKADDRWHQVVTLLEQVKGLRHWQVVDKSDELMKHLIQTLRKASLLSNLSIARRGEKLIVSGKLSDEKTQKLMSVLRDTMQRWPDVGEIVLQEIEAKDNYKTFFPSSIIGVGGNQKAAYIELNNGMRFSQGALLPNGYYIENIDSNDGIELSFEGQLFHVPLVIS